MVFYQNPHAPSCPWHDITVQQGAPNLKWCEETLCAWISEPANTWSNLGYLIVACMIYYLSLKKNQSSSLKLLGPVIFFMGCMSFFYHLSNFYTTQILDYLGMFALLGWISGMNLVRLGKLQPHQLLRFNVIFSLILIPVLHIMYIYGLHYQILIAIGGTFCIVTDFLSERKIKVSRRYLFMAIALVLIALAFSVADVTRFWCHPSQHGWFSHGHAIWHWLSSIAMMMIYLHFSQPALNQTERRD